MSGAERSDGRREDYTKTSRPEREGERSGAGNSVVGAGGSSRDRSRDDDDDRHKSKKRCGPL